MNSLKYFGTDTRTPGHYFFNFDSTGQYMQSADTKFSSLPFNPESYGKIKTNSYPNYKLLPNGTVQFDKVGDYTILAITGSAIDRRPGCKSVFFAKADWTEEQIIQKIKMTPVAMKIINSMPFNVVGFKDTISTPLSN